MRRPASKRCSPRARSSARAQFAAEGVEAGKVKFLRYGKFRYQNQEHTTEVLVAGGKVTDERLAEIEAAFHETYEREYTYRLDAPVEMVGIHLVASAEVGKLTMRKREATGAKAEAALKGHRDVDYALEGIHSAAIYDGAKLEPGMSFAGPGDRRGFRQHHRRPPRQHGSRSTATATSTSIWRREETAMPKKVNDPITLEIIQNSLQATADEMFAVMKKTAMSSIIYEVLDMGTGITDARGALASSGAGIPAFIGVLDKAVKVIVKKFAKPGDIEPGDVFATNDPYYGGVTHLNDIIVAMPVFAGGAHHRLDRQHRAQFRRRRHGAGLADRRGDRDLPGGAAAAGHQDDLEGRDDPPGDGHHQGQFAHARRARRRRLGGDRLGAHRRQAAASSSPRNTASRPSRTPCRRSWISASRFRSPSSPSCPRARSSCRRSRMTAASSM